MTYLIIEPIERGPKCMDRSSAEYDGYKAEKAAMQQFMEHQKLLTTIRNRAYTEQDLHEILCALANTARKCNTNTSLLDQLDDLALSFGEGL